jgi:hypothetical protein
VVVLPPRGVADPRGRPVVLDERLWQEKILRGHPEMLNHDQAVLHAVARPDHEVADPVFASRRRFYLRSVGPSNWLMVVVSYEQTPARIISAFGMRRGPKSWRA